MKAKEIISLLSEEGVIQYKETRRIIRKFRKEESKELLEMMDKLISQLFSDSNCGSPWSSTLYVIWQSCGKWFVDIGGESPSTGFRCGEVPFECLMDCCVYAANEAHARFRCGII